MSQKSVRLILLLTLASILSACASPQAAPTVAPTQDVAATQTVEAAANSNRVATSVAATLTAQPTNTPLPTATATTKPSATPTTPPPTSTPTVAPTKVAPTKVPVTSLPTATAAPASASIYSTAAGGPQGYLSTLGCYQVGGTPCQSVMPRGDISFNITLESTLDALLAIFVPFGLSVEKNGANAADMYMTVDAGWLEPGSQARMGTSHTFNQPGHYVIRTNGCLVTQASYPNCTWWTVNGTIITFDIQ
jgi:hypothetical protein